MQLENPPENNCFACGPANERGLRMNWELSQDEHGAFIEGGYAPREHETGWPGLLHTGLHYTIMFDAAYWAALTLTGKVHVARGPQTFDQKRLPRTGRPFRIVARVTSSDPVTTRVESFTDDGRAAATLDVTWRTQSRAAIERSGLELPQYLMDEMEP